MPSRGSKRMGVLLVVLCAVALLFSQTAAQAIVGPGYWENDDQMVEWLKSDPGRKATAIVEGWVDKFPNVTQADLGAAVPIIGPYGYDEDFVRCAVEGVITVQPGDQRRWYYRVQGDPSGTITWVPLSTFFQTGATIRVFKYGENAFVAKACANFGAPPVFRGTLRVIKFDDSNMNGNWDGGELELSGWDVSYSGPENGSGKTRLTDSVLTGSYTVHETVKPGWMNTTPTTRSAVVQPCTTTTVTFGNVELGSIAGVKWDDTDCDHTRDGSEVTLDGWQITLSGNDRAGNPVNRGPISTGPDGAYKFDDLPPSDTSGYTITETLADPEHWGPTTPLDPVPSPLPDPVAPQAYTIVLDEGEDRTGVDFGNVQLGKICGLKYYDANASLPPEDPRNGNGEYDDGEPLIEGWTFRLNGTCDLGVPIAQREAVSGADGTFCFPRLYPTHVGDGYTVCEVVPEDWILTYPQPRCRDTLLDEGQEIDTGFEFGNLRLVHPGARTMGYWKTHPEAITAEMYAALSTLPAFTGVDTWEELYPIFNKADARDMKVMLRAQLAAMTLNVLADIVEPGQWIYVGDIPGAYELFGSYIVTVQHVLDTVEAAYPWNGWDRDQQEAAKEALDRGNNEENLVSPTP